MNSPRRATADDRRRPGWLLSAVQMLCLVPTGVLYGTVAAGLGAPSDAWAVPGDRGAITRDCGDT